MRLHHIALLSIGALALLPNDALAADVTELTNDKEKASYSLGMNMGNYIRSNELDVDFDIILQAVKAKATGESTLLDDQEAQTFMRQFLQNHAQQRLARNKDLGAKFLEENKPKPGVVALPSGLQYKILSEGQGPSPKTTDTVTAHYRGTFIDGTEFDSSYKGGEPAAFALNRVVKGWTEGVSMMNKGAKWQLFIPSDLAYGDAGYRSTIPPGATLLFDIELIDFKSPEPPKPVQPVSSTPVTSDIIKVPSKEGLERGEQIEVIKKEDLERLQEEQRRQAEAK